VGTTPLQVTPGRVSPIASTSPWWASQDHEHHPREPSCHERAPASEPAGRILAGSDRDAEDLSGGPSAFTPVTTSTWTFAVLPASRTLTTRASAQHDRVGAGRLGDGCERLGPRRPGCGPSCEIWDFDSFVIPSAQASFSSRRVETPSTSQVAITLVRATSERRRRSVIQSGIAPLTKLWDL